jgi:3-oxoacyl-[acyl-carrier protein] reductase
MRRILISGGSRGIGRACVRAFAQNGDAVAFLYCHNDEAAREATAETGAIAIRADISDPDAVRAAVAEAEKKLGGTIDVLVNNAAVAWIGLMQDMTDAEWRRVLDTDLSGAFYLSRAVVGSMIRNHYGRILHVGSMWGKTGASCEVAYSAAKAGLRGLTMSMAKELGPSGITVNCIEPGLIDTDMNASLDADTKASLCAETPLGRIGTPDEVAEAILFLTSNRAAFITGQILGVDGGMAI